MSLKTKTIRRFANFMGRDVKSKSDGHAQRPTVMDIQFCNDRPNSHIPPKAIKQWSMAPDGSPDGIKSAVKCPSDVAFITDSYFVVADSEGHRLLFFDLQGRLCDTMLDGVVWPNSVAVTPDNKIVLTDRKKKLTKIYDIEGNCIRAWGETLIIGEDEIELRPHGVAVNSKGQIIVTDSVINTVYIYSPEGKLLHQFDGKGGPNTLKLPFYVTVDNKDNIIVSDNMNYSVKVYDPMGNFKYKIGSSVDWGRRNFNCPYGVAVDSENNIFIADGDVSRIAVYRGSDGDGMGDVLKKNQCTNPCGLAINSQGNMVLLENNLEWSNIQMYNLDYTHNEIDC